MDNTEGTNSFAHFSDKILWKRISPQTKPIGLFGLFDRTKMLNDKIKTTKFTWTTWQLISTFNNDYVT